MLNWLLYTRLTNTSKIWACFSFYIENSFFRPEIHFIFGAPSMLIWGIQQLIKNTISHENPQIEKLSVCCLAALRV